MFTMSNISFVQSAANMHIETKSVLYLKATTLITTMKKEKKQKAVAENIEKGTDVPEVPQEVPDGH